MPGLGRVHAEEDRLSKISVICCGELLGRSRPSKLDQDTRSIFSLKDLEAVSKRTKKYIKKVCSLS